MIVYRIRLPRISLISSVAVFAVLIFAAVMAVLATPHLVAVTDNVDLEASVPQAFGDWKMIPSGAVQVRLTTGDETNMNQPYDQTVMRTYVNTKTGEYVQLALAWGRRQRQEVKVHRPDLCYVAQGYKVDSLSEAVFEDVGHQKLNVTGKRMYASNSRSGEAVAYWIRIGSLYSEDALETRLYILAEGLKGRIPDGILVRASRPVRTSEDAMEAYPSLESFLKELVVAAPPSVQSYLIR